MNHTKHVLLLGLTRLLTYQDLLAVVHEVDALLLSRRNRDGLVVDQPTVTERAQVGQVSGLLQRSWVVLVRMRIYINILLTSCIRF